MMYQDFIFTVGAGVEVMNEQVAILIPCYNEERTVYDVVTSFRQVLPEYKTEYSEMQKELHAELNALIKGLKQAGIEEIVINDAHNTMTNINLSEIGYGYGILPQYCFCNTGITSLSTDCTLIDVYAFASCQNLSQVNLPNIMYINTSAFDGCINLEIVHLASSIETIKEDAFSNCPKLSLITIDKEEESIEGAPWGASNATVVWNG